MGTQDLESNRVDGRIAVKRLLRQHLSHDDELIDVHPLAELILSEGVRMGAGSSIKTDGEESDPWALVAVVDIARNRVRRHGSVELVSLRAGSPSAEAILGLPRRYPGAKLSTQLPARPQPLTSVQQPASTRLLPPDAESAPPAYSASVQDAPAGAESEQRG